MKNFSQKEIEWWLLCFNFSRGFDVIWYGLSKSYAFYSLPLLHTIYVHDSWSLKSSQHLSATGFLSVFTRLNKSLSLRYISSLLLFLFFFFFLFGDFGDFLLLLVNGNQNFIITRGQAEKGSSSRCSELRIQPCSWEISGGGQGKRLV